jgi:hypothetical protein
MCLAPTKRPVRRLALFVHPIGDAPWSEREQILEDGEINLC